MKREFLSRMIILSLSAVAFSVSAFAQTTDEGPGPSEQPSAPMEIGQTQPSLSNPANAQPTDAQPGGPSGEGPAKSDLGVARISMIHGDVSTQRGDSGDWSAATLNQPVMGGDKISTGDSARAELQLDFANILRLGANSKANIATFTQKDIQIQLSQGIANYTVSKDSEAEPEIDTPNVSVHPAHHDGVFRVEVRPDGDTIVIVRKGEAQIATPQGSAEVRAGEMATIRGDSNSAQYKVSDAPNPDDWDRWNSDRDHLIRNAQSWHHTNRYYTGAESLDTYGNWKNVPDYGDVWVPNEPEGWVPYREGNWVWEPSYGWTWVGYEPWGWAPYHYGRWFWYDNAWAWWPGPAYGWYRPFWAPAYVSFWGWGGGFGFGFGWGGWGGFGWLPIGPCDWFHPWWGGYRGRFGWFDHGRGFDRFGGFRPLHAGNRFSNVAGLHNDHIVHAMSTVNAGHFGNGAVRGVGATREQVNGARMMAGNLPVVPSRASLSASGRAAAPSTVRGGSERFFGSVHNNVARPQSFAQQTAGLRQTMQQNHVGGFSAGSREPSGVSTAQHGSMNSGAMRPSIGAVPNHEANNNGARSLGAPASGATRSEPQRGTSVTANGTRDGFRPFTPPSHSEGVTHGGAPAGAPHTSGSYWSRSAPSAIGGMAGRSGMGAYGGGRPQLDMRQPIVRGPSYGGSRPSYGSRPGYGGMPNYGGSHGAPSYGGSRPAPGYGGAPHGSYGGGGGHPSAPSGGGHMGGGGGGHAGGGGHSGGGHR